jgi:hypothetical protein
VRRLYTLVKNCVRYLSFVENFKAREMSVTFAGTSEVMIQNPFKDIIPTRWVVVDVTGGGFTPVRGDSSWTVEKLYLSNPLGGNIVAKIVFMR